jgi:hypothetical protein
LEATVDPSLQDLEQQRKDLFRQMETLGDFRRGTISVNYRKCGKSNCVCARKDHPGHGPQYLWNVSIGGKTQARNLPLGPELEKVEKEVERYHAFLRLSQELIEVNGRICQLRPVRKLEDENELEQLKKNCGGISPRSGRRSRSTDWACVAGSPATRTPGSGGQRNVVPALRQPSQDGAAASKRSRAPIAFSSMTLSKWRWRSYSPSVPID